jgi:hypothetical protein
MIGLEEDDRAAGMISDKITVVVVVAGCSSPGARSFQRLEVLRADTLIWLGKFPEPESNAFFSVTIFLSRGVGLISFICFGTIQERGNTIISALYISCDASE